MRCRPAQIFTTAVGLLLATQTAMAEKPPTVTEARQRALADVTIPASAPKALVLSPAEREWIERNPRVRLGVDPSWPPFSFIDTAGKHAGIDADLLRLLGERTGIAFELSPSPSWRETMNRMESGTLDLVPGVAYQAGRTEGYDYTVPYLSFPVAIVTRVDAPFNLRLAQIGTETLAMPAGYITTLRVMQENPTFHILQTENTLAALRLVGSGKAFATVENLAAATYLIKKHGLTNLKISGITDYRFDLRIAVSLRQPELTSILNKALLSLEERELYLICDRWIAIDYSSADAWQRFARLALGIGLVAGGIVALVGVWNRRLSRALAEKTRVQGELAQANARLESANVRLRELNDENQLFMNIAAHDLRNPLSTIILSCEMLAPAESRSASDHGGLTVARPGLVSGISEAAWRMSELLQNFLSAQVIAQGESALSLEPTDLTPVVERAVERHRPHAEMKRIALDADLQPVSRVGASRSALDQVLDNLISNALKFAPPAGRVCVSLGSCAAGARIAIADDGPGIAPEDSSKLFQRFTKLKARPTGGEPSTGLGLFIVKHFVQGMHGRVWCESHEGKGATFIVELPGIDAPDAATATAQAPE